MKPKSFPVLLMTAALSGSLFGEETAAPATEKSPAAETASNAPAYDFGDHSSQTLTAKAWEALQAKNHAAVDAFTGKCIEIYEADALKMQASLTEPAPSGKEHDYWALNDVGTCYFIRAQSKEERGDTAGAIADYKAVSEKFAYAQVWDTKGWFWRPADAASAKVKSLEFDALD